MTRAVASAARRPLAGLLTSAASQADRKGACRVIVDVRPPQLGHEQVTAGEDVERQAAPGVVTEPWKTGLPDDLAQHQAVAHPVTVDQVLVAQGDAEHPLARHGGNVMPHSARSARVDEASGKALDHPKSPIRCPQQQRTAVRTDRPASETRHHRTPFDACKGDRVRATLRQLRGSLLRSDKSLSQKHFPTFSTLMHPPLVRNAD